MIRQRQLHPQVRPCAAAADEPAASTIRGPDAGSSAPSSSASSGQAPEDRWWDRINKRSVRGPGPAAPPEQPSSREGWNELRMGEKGYRQFEVLKRDERQRVWDSMRRIAAQRYADGQMPAWFKPEWLDMQEAPMNTYWRQAGLSVYQQDSTWAGGGGGGEGNGGGGGGGWFGWWREDDPYWPLRDSGGHPMRGWTLCLAALLAVGGGLASVLHASPECARIGMAAGAVLALCGAAMSDMQHGSTGELAVKAAWATCLLLAVREYVWGWDHQRANRRRGGRRTQQAAPIDAGGPGLGATGWVCALTCALYMWTGMAGLSEYALPANPGEAFKMVNVARKHKIWEYWGYGDVQMR